jgi:hypothetical protein
MHEEMRKKFRQRLAAHLDRLQHFDLLTRRFVMNGGSTRLM